MSEPSHAVHTTLLTRTFVAPRSAASLVVAALLAACSSTPTRGGAGTGASSGSTSSSSSASSSSSSGALVSDCVTLCATETKACPKTTTECAAVCVFDQVEVTWCKSVAEAATACYAKEPATSFTCDTNGQPQPTSGVCTAEATALSNCWNDGPTTGLPDLTEPCTAVCERESSLSCADENCVTDCEAAVKPGVKCNGAFAALLDCAWKQAPNSFACDTATPPVAALTSGLCPLETLLLAECLQ
jgi:hypothetical protein